MKIKRAKRFEAEVATSSLNDIMFFLLLFFLIVSTFANPNVIKLMLPGANASQTISKKQITLSVTAEKKYFIDKTEISFEDLEAELTTQKARIGEDNLTVVLRADNRLTVQDLVDILSMGSKLQIKMLLATNKKTE